MAKSKQHRREDKRVNPNHIMSHNRKVHDGVYEEDTITAMCWWLYDKITRK